MDKKSSAAGPGRRLVLLRHAETADNVAGRFLGRGDSPLTDEGVDAAIELGEILRARSGPSGVRTFTSPARRAIETAVHLRLHEPTVDDAFREIDFGSWEGLTQAEVAQRDPATFAAFERGDIGGFPDGETVDEVRERAVDAIDRHRGSNLVVVTHATVVRIVVSSLLGLPASRYRSTFGRPANLSWTELERTDDGWRLLTYDARMVRGR